MDVDTDQSDLSDVADLAADVTAATEKLLATLSGDIDPPKKRTTGGERRPELTWETFQPVLENLAQCGVKYRSCELAGFGYHTVADRIALEERSGNEEWRRAWEDAMVRYRESLIVEAQRRGVEGVLEPVFHQGKMVGVVRKYSDRLLETKLKAHVPEFRDKLAVEHSGSVGTGGERPDVFEGLSLEAKRQIRDIIVKDLEAQRKATAEALAITKVEALPEEDAE